MCSPFAGLPELINFNHLSKTWPEKKTDDEIYLRLKINTQSGTQQKEVCRAKIYLVWSEISGDPLWDPFVLLYDKSAVILT